MSNEYIVLLLLYDNDTAECPVWVPISIIFELLNNVEKYYDIEALYIFIRGKNNFRKQLYQEYKANRPAPNPPTIIAIMKSTIEVSGPSCLAIQYPTNAPTDKKLPCAKLRTPIKP